MDYSDDVESRPVFYIGQHESKRALHVSAELVQHAQDLGVCIAPRPPPVSQLC
jgi:protein arginine N-methyltransferase 5